MPTVRENMGNWLLNKTRRSTIGVGNENFFGMWNGVRIDDAAVNRQLWANAIARGQNLMFTEQNGRGNIYGSEGKYASPAMGPTCYPAKGPYISFASQGVVLPASNSLTDEQVIAGTTGTGVTADVTGLAKKVGTGMIVAIVAGVLIVAAIVVVIVVAVKKKKKSEWQS